MPRLQTRYVPGMPLLLLTALLACAPRSANGVASPAGERPGSALKLTPLLFWEVEKDGVRSHLLGTCHMGTSLNEALPSAHRVHLDKARVVVTEAEMPEDPMPMLVMLMSGTRLSTRMSPEAFHRLVSRTPQLPATIYDRMPPWAATMLSSSANAMGTGRQRGMDAEVVERGAKGGAQRLYVETLEEQAALLASFDAQFLEGLEQAPDLISEAASFGELDRLCREGIVPEGGELLDNAGAFTEALLHARNQAWMPKLLPELAQGGAFVAVGAAHMLGKEGLIELLENEGYTVTQRSGERRVAPPGAYEPPAAPTPYDPVKAAQVAAHLAPVVDQGCVPKGIMMECFFDSDAQCREVLTADLALCAGQNSAWPSSGTIGAPLVIEATNCMVTGALMEGLTRPLRPAASCQMLASMMQAASKK